MEIEHRRACSSCCCVLRHAYDEKLHHHQTCFLNTRVVTTVEYPVHFVTFVQFSLTAVSAQFYTLKYEKNGSGQFRFQPYNVVVRK